MPRGPTHQPQRRTSMLAGMAALVAATLLGWASISEAGRWAMWPRPHPPLADVWELGPGPRLPLPRATAAPQLDGKLDDACWRQAAQTGPFVWTFCWDSGEWYPPMGYTTTKAASNAWLCWDKDHLYAAFRLEEPYMAFLQTKTANVWWNDDVFLRLSPDYLTVGAGRWAKQAVPELRWAQTVTVDPRRFEGVVDVWIPHSWVDPEFCRTQRQRGQEVWTYTCAYPLAPTDPVQYCLLRLWRARREGLSGAGIFNYQHFIANLHPGAQRFPMPHYEMLRAGIEDHQYFEILDELIARAAASGVIGKQAADQARSASQEALRLALDGAKADRSIAEILADVGAARRLLAEQIVRMKKLEK